MSDADYVAPTGATAAPSSATVLDEVLDLFNEKVEEKWATYKVTKNQRLTVKQRVTLASEQFQRIIKGARGEDGQLDNLRFSAQLIAETNAGIYVDGKAVTNQGSPVIMLDDAFLKSVSSPSLVASVRAFFGGDGGDADILAIGNDITVRSGFAAAFSGQRATPVEFVDPT